MAEKTFKLEVVTPERLVLKQEAASIVVPGVEGSLGILAHHAPVMAELSLGEVRVRDKDGKTTRYAVSGGFMEVAANTVRILADTFESAEEIDVARAEAAVQRARERLTEKSGGVDMTRAEAALRRALNRLRVARGE
jgi:F-type H+-transporting ATPase subunit epsilon